MPACPLAVGARGSPPSLLFGSGWAAVCPARGVTDSWQLPAEGDVPVCALLCAQPAPWGVCH